MSEDFFESFNALAFSHAAGTPLQFIQDNHAKSVHHVLNGLHYQLEHPQDKLVRAIEGEIFDVAVDIRRCSAHFGKWVGIHLSGSNKKKFESRPDLRTAILSCLKLLKFFTKPPIFTYPFTSEASLGMIQIWRFSGH
jgi:dTDP-4-dehydrorhamnose 3,5-epimerase